MAKAYDRVAWLFLTKMLRAFGFGERWIDMVRRLISNIGFPSLLIGHWLGFFNFYWGFVKVIHFFQYFSLLELRYYSYLNKLLEDRAFVGF